MKECRNNDQNIGPGMKFSSTFRLVLKQEDDQRSMTSQENDDSAIL